jgi:tetratricopeptide (TPR) repeat protein
MMQKIAGYLLLCLILFCCSPAALAQDAEFNQLVALGIDSLKTANDLKNALTICNRMIDKYKSDNRMQDIVSQAFLMRGKIYRRMGRTQSDLAIGALEHGLQLNPNSPDLNREMGLVRKDLENFSEARIYLEKAVRLNKHDRLAWQALVEISEKRGTSEQRIFAYEGYLADDPANAGILTKLGMEYLSIANKVEAENTFVQALRNDPRQTTAHLGLASLMEERGDWAGAVGEYKAILEYEPANTAAATRLADAMPQLQKQQTIAQLLEEAKLASQSQHPKQWEKARQNFESVLAKAPQNQDAQKGSREIRKRLYDYWLAKGQRAESMDSLGRALDCFTVSLVYADSDKDQKLAFEKQKQTAIKLGKKTEALTAYDAARLAMKSGEFSKALKNLFAAEVLDPSLGRQIEAERDTAEIGQNYQRGLEARARGDWELAKMYFKLVMDADPDYQEVKQNYEEANKQVSISFLASSYDSAMAKQDWAAARTYLQKLITVAPNNATYITDLKTVARQIRSQQIGFIVRLVLWVAGGVMAIFLLWRFRGTLRKMLSDFWHAVIEVLKWLLHKKLFAVITILLFGVLLIRIFLWTPVLTRLPNVTKWVNDNEGMIDLLGILSSAGWAVFIYLKSRPAKEKRSQASLSQQHAINEDKKERFEEELRKFELTPIATPTQKPTKPKAVPIGSKRRAKTT